MTSDCRLMSNGKLPQNVVKGHLVTFGPGAKNQMDSIIACCFIMHLCMGNSDMGTLPIVAWWSFLQS